MKKKTSEPSFLKLARPGARRRSKAWKIVPLTTLLIFGGIFFWSGFEVERVKESKTSSEKGENKALLLRLKKKKKQPNGKKKIEKIHWPHLVLSGVGSPSAGHKAFAIINHHYQAVGEVVEGVKLIEVKDRGVIVSYQGETHILPLER